MSIREKAIELHDNGYNCAQSIVGACSEHIGLDVKTCMSISGGLGGGLRCGEVCGALVGAIMVLGCLFPYYKEGDLDAATMIANMTKECTRSFRNKFGCIRCLELKQAGFSCDDTIGYAADYIEEIIKKKVEE